MDQERRWKCLHNSCMEGALQSTGQNAGEKTSNHRVVGRSLKKIVFLF